MEQSDALVQEIRLFQELKHDHIITFIGACSYGSHFYLCTEFATNGSLYNFLHKESNEYATTLPSFLLLLLLVFFLNQLETTLMGWIPRPRNTGGQSTLSVSSLESVASMPLLSNCGDKLCAALRTHHNPFA